MPERVIDADKVIAMGKATVKAAVDIEAKAKAARAIIDEVAHLVSGAPDVYPRARKAAGLMAESAGEAHKKAVAFIDDSKALEELSTWDFWLPKPGNLADPDKVKAVTSDEFGATPLGVSGYLMAKYGRGAKLLVPGKDSLMPVVPRADNLASLPGSFKVNGKEFVVRPSGLAVPAGSSADPRITPPVETVSKTWKEKFSGRGVRDTPINPPRWASTGAKTLGWVGAGLTVYGAGYNQWQQDLKYHPEMNEAERYARAAGNAALEGGFSAAGAWSGAVAGAKGGALVGAAIGSFFPGPGTAIGAVVGGLAGGLAGGFAGGKVGAAAGRWIKSWF